MCVQLEESIRMTNLISVPTWFSGRSGFASRRSGSGQAESLMPVMKAQVGRGTT
jgi:hypothetical protein